MRRIMVLWLFLPLLFAGCASTSGLLEDKADGVSKKYRLPPEKAHVAALGALAWVDAFDIEEHKEEGCITAELPASAFSYGGIIAVWIEKSGTASSKVTVLTRRSLATTVGTPLTEEEFHERFVKAAKIVRSGKRLPKEEPD